MTSEKMIITWTSIVSYEQAAEMLSTRPGNGKKWLDGLTAAQCDAHAHSAWLCNELTSYVAHKSAALHKKGRYQ